VDRETNASIYPPLFRQNYLLAQAASIAIYAVPCIIGLLYLFPFWFDIGASSLHCCAIVLVIVWAACPAIAIYNLGKHLENFSDDKRYWKNLTVSIRSLLSCYIYIVFYFTIASGEIMIIVDIVVILILFFFFPVRGVITAIEIFEQNKSSEDFVGGMEEFADSIFVQFDKFDTEIMKSLPLIFTPYYMNQMFASARYYAATYGYKERIIDPKTKSGQDREQ